MKLSSPMARMGLSAVVLALTGMGMRGETHFVGVDDSGFSPAEQSIAVGDTVVWVNNDEFFPHTTTSDLLVTDPDYWNGALFDFEDTFQKTFNNPGTFYYHDAASTSTGSIIVGPAMAPNIVLGAARVSGGQFLFEATGLTVGKTHLLQASTNLISWSAISTNVAVAGTNSFTNAVTAGRWFYQVVEVQ
jgi:plastocyanin